MVAYVLKEAGVYVDFRVFEEDEAFLEDYELVGVYAVGGELGVEISVDGDHCTD